MPVSMKGTSMTRYYEKERFFAAPAARSETSEFEPFSPPAAPSDARDRTRSEKDAAQPENSSHDIAKSDMLAAEPKKKQRGAS